MSNSRNINKTKNKDYDYLTCEKLTANNGFFKQVKTINSISLDANNNENVNENKVAASISLSDPIKIVKADSLTTKTLLKTDILRCNIIDNSLGQGGDVKVKDIIDGTNDGGFIKINNIINVTKPFGVGSYIIGKDISVSNLDISKNTFVKNLHSKKETIYFEKDSSFSNIVYANNIDLSAISNDNNTINITSDVSIIGHLKVNKIATDNIISSKDNIVINSNIQSDSNIKALDINVDGRLNTNKLIVNDISSVEKIVIYSDISFNNLLTISDISLEKMYYLDPNKNIINLHKNTTFNKTLTIGKDVSFGGTISSNNNDIIALTGHLGSEKKININTIKTDKIEINNINDSSYIIFNNDVSINGGVYAKMPYYYGAEVHHNISDIIGSTNKKKGALYLLVPQELEDNTIYTSSEMKNFDPDSSANIIRPTNPDVTLYIRSNKKDIVKVATLNADVSWNNITIRNKIHYDINDICYITYQDFSNEIWRNEGYSLLDISHTFDISTSDIIGLKNGHRNDDSFNRIYYFDLNAIDPEGLDVSFLLTSVHNKNSEGVNDFSLIKLEEYRINDISKTRVKIMTPYNDFTNTTAEDLSFNVAGHDNVNYVIKTIYLNVNGNKIPKKPVWDEIRIDTWDICNQKINYIDQSWNDLCYNNPISTADIRDISTFTFDLNLYRFFANDNSNKLQYNIDLSAIFPDTDLDLSFNISHLSLDNGNNDLTHNEKLKFSGNRISLCSTLEDICKNVDYTTINNVNSSDFKDISINIIAHNYYEFDNTGSYFDYLSAKQDGYDNINVPTSYIHTYSKDVSRNIVIRIVGIINNNPPEWSKITNISISHDEINDWDYNFYNDFSFNNEFYDISASRTQTDVSTSYIYYIWDSSSVLDVSRLQYKIDLSAIDPEGFNVDFTILKNDNSYNVELSLNQLVITTPGTRDSQTKDLSVVLWPTDNGSLPEQNYSDISKTLLFHPFLYKFTEFTFTNCDASGRNGPSFNDCKSWYNSRHYELFKDSQINVFKENASLDRWWENQNYFSMNGNDGIQIWTVPATGLYDITIAGAGGGRTTTQGITTGDHGYGLKIDLSYHFIKGDKYRLLIGQKGKLGSTYVSENTDGFYGEAINYAPYSSSGGGGTYLIKDDAILNDTNINAIVDNSSIIIAIAGGGSGGITYNLPESDFGNITAIRRVADASINSHFNGIDGSGNNISNNSGGENGRGGGGGNVATTKTSIASGGGGGGGFIGNGGFAGYNQGYDLERSAIQAQSFINGGKGGFTPHILDEEGNISIKGLGKSQEGGFGGGGAGGEGGGSGGGGGYSGGGSDYYGNVIIPENKTIAGGGGSFVNKEVLKYNPNIFQQVMNNQENNNNEYNGFIKIKFNPYNK